MAAPPPPPPADAAKSAVESEGGAAAAAAAAAAAGAEEEEEAGEAVDGMDEDEAAEILSAMLGLAPPSARKRGKKKVGWQQGGAGCLAQGTCLACCARR